MGELRQSMRLAGIAWIAILGAAGGCRQILGLDSPSLRDGGGPGGDGSDAQGGQGLRKQITIDGSRIPGPLTDFPVWIELDDPDLAAHARPDGADIYFTAADGTPLDHEIQTWAGGRLLAWVRLPLLPAGTSTIFYVRYGELAGARPPNAPGVFRASFLAVWHLDDSLTTTAVADATGMHPGTAAGLSAASRTPGQLGGGITFDGTGSAQIAFTNPFLGSTPHTISAWVNQAPSQHTSTVLVVGAAATDQARWLVASERNGQGPNLVISQYSDDFKTATSIEGGGWKLVAWTLEGASKKAEVYVDGVQVALANFASPPNTMGTTGLIGVAPAPAFGTSTGMIGALDEVRIASVVRTPEWLATEYANQSSPATFYTVGPEEPAP